MSFGNVWTVFQVIVIPMPKNDYGYYIHANNDISNGYFIDVTCDVTVELFRKKFQISSPIKGILTTSDRHSDGNIPL